jgi:GntR family transcriptional regulator / MocR family aminotransferase
VGSSREPVLLLELDRDGGLPLHEQLERRLREDIRSGRLAPGAPLPSSRSLAVALGVSRGVVSEAYVQLASEGYLTSRQGARVRVASAVQRQRPREPARSLLPRFRYDLRPGVPDLAGFPMDAWQRSLRAAWRDAPFDSLGQPDPRGVPELREALAGQLARTRGAAADPEHLLVCGGFRDAFSVLCRWLHVRGADSVAVEDPGWHPHRLAIEQAGLGVVPVPVDDEGLRVDVLEATGATIVVVTPAHQFPTGAVLSRERRAALVEWAAAGERLVVEDDYDSELRYDGGGPGSLQGLAAERVVHIGSASKRLAPGVRLGWMLTPSWLTWPLTAALAVEGGGGDVVAQLALRDFLERGELDRHLRRMRARYERRRASLLAALARDLPVVRAHPAPAAGLFVLAALPAELDEGALVARAAELGVGVEGLELHRFEPGRSGGLVLGFGALAEPAIERAVALLASAAG